MDASPLRRATTRVLVVDDSVVARRMVARSVVADPALELAAMAANGRLALDKLDLVRPDVIVLDLEMPDMDGFDTLAAIRTSHPDLPVIVYSHLTERGAAATLKALALGATGFALKPSGMGFDAELVDAELIPLIKALAPTGRPTITAEPAARLREPSSRGRLASAVVVAVSTGGPNALGEVIGGLPSDLRAPVFVVQHMPPIFTRLLADRLDSRSALRVVEAGGGDTVERGTVYIAPGGHHMAVARGRGGTTILVHDGPPENFCRPAGDVLFRSAAAVYGSELLGVVLTGMGRDGLRGAEAVRAAGGSVIAQSEQTSVVASMPAAVAEAGLADAVVPLELIGSELVHRVSRGW